MRRLPFLISSGASAAKEQQTGGDKDEVQSRRRHRRHFNMSKKKIHLAKTEQKKVQVMRLEYEGTNQHLPFFLLAPPLWQKN